MKDSKGNSGTHDKPMGMKKRTGCDLSVSTADNCGSFDSEHKYLGVRGSLASASEKCGAIVDALSCACSPNNSRTEVSRTEVSRTEVLLSGKGKSMVGLDQMIVEMKETAGNAVHLEVPFGKPIAEVYDGVHDGHILGSGVASVVRLCEHKKTGVKYAVKCLDIGRVKNEQGLRQIRDEIYIMCQLDHPNIVRLEEVYESQNKIYLVMENCEGGELFDRLDEQPDYHYTEQECARLVKQMLKAVRYVHSKGIVHRDLKLENFLFTSRDPDAALKMIDFGLSKHFSESLSESVGTPYTTAPEVILGKYDERCDMWSIGVLAYLVLSGDAPFGGCDGGSLRAVRENILAGSFAFEPEYIWDGVSQQAKDFICKLLVTDPKRRLYAHEAQQSEWLKEWAVKETKPSSNILNPGVVKALVSFKEYGVVQKLLCQTVSFALVPDQIQDLRVEFEKLDTDDLGEISLDDLKKVLLEVAEAGVGCLSESEVEDICNAMHICNSERKIRWHDFIAAGLSHCKVDDRNLRLAFDRLDKDHTGYIGFDDIMDLVGSDAEESMKSSLLSAAEDIQCDHSRISYEDFLLLAKGQKRRVIQRYRQSSKNFECGDGNDSADVEMNMDGSNQIRMGILEASRLFEENQIRHILQGQLAKKACDGAGLVMRRGETKILSTEEVRKILKVRQEDQLTKTKKLSNRSGRRGHKTMSDLTEMFAPAMSIEEEEPEENKDKGERRRAICSKTKSDVSGMMMGNFPTLSKVATLSSLMEVPKQEGAC